VTRSYTECGTTRYGYGSSNSPLKEVNRSFYLERRTEQGRFSVVVTCLQEAFVLSTWTSSIILVLGTVAGLNVGWIVTTGLDYIFYSGWKLETSSKQHLSPHARGTTSMFVGTPYDRGI